MLNTHLVLLTRVTISTTIDFLLCKQSYIMNGNGRNRMRIEVETIRERREFVVMWFTTYIYTNMTCRSSY